MKGRLFILLITISCVATKKQHDSVTIFSFKDCALSQNFTLSVNTIEDYRLEKIEEDGFCEYRLSYDDGSVFYVGSNVYTGSTLNYRNRLANGIKTYSSNRTKSDTIRNSGEYNGRYWLEWINGSYVMGYVNASDTSKFFDSIESIKLENQ